MKFDGFSMFLWRIVVYTPCFARSHENIMAIRPFSPSVMNGLLNDISERCN